MNIVDNIIYKNKKQSEELDKLFKCYFPNDNITNFGSACSYCLAIDTNINEIIGITRTVSSFQLHFKTQHNKILNEIMEYLINNLKLDRQFDFYFLTGIYVKEDYRDKGIATQLLKYRLKDIKIGSYLYTDILKTSPLLCQILRPKGRSLRLS
jgi:ribosomal protein S18 acetylase RimI-like enzyme